MSDNLPHDSSCPAESRPPARGNENWEHEALERIAMAAIREQRAAGAFSSASCF